MTRPGPAIPALCPPDPKADAFPCARSLCGVRCEKATPPCSCAYSPLVLLGYSCRRFLAPQPNSAVRDASAYGVLKMTLHAKSYDWRFVPVAGEAFEDVGSAACHSTLIDVDEDGMTDSYEATHLCLDAQVDDADGDPDSDNLLSGDEFAARNLSVRGLQEFRHLAPVDLVAFQAERHPSAVPVMWRCREPRILS